MTKDLLEGLRDTPDEALLDRAKAADFLTQLLKGAQDLDDAPVLLKQAFIRIGSARGSTGGMAKAAGLSPHGLTGKKAAKHGVSLVYFLKLVRSMGYKITISLDGRK
jgi:hypothetical protein